MAQKISAATRQKTATVRVGGKAKFPIFNAKSARSAVKLEGNAKPPLTPGQKASVDRKAAQYGARPRGA